MYVQGMSIISAKELYVTYGVFKILDNAEITIDQGERIGLVGRNGAGKSTLLKILTDVMSPDSGNIIRRRGLVSGFLPQEFVLDDDSTVLENIRNGAAYAQALLDEYEGGDPSPDRSHELELQITAFDAWNLDVRVATLMDKLRTPEGDRPVKELSGGERRRVALCSALVGNPDFLALDEPTNHLDTATIEWLEGYIAKYRGTVLLVTHDRHFLDNVCSKIVELANGTFHSYQGNYSQYLEQKAQRMENERVLDKKRKNFIRRELDWVRRGPKARGTKSQARLGRFYDAVNQEGVTDENDVDLLLPPPKQLGNKIVNLHDVGAGYDNTFLFRNLTMEMEAGTRIGIIGPNGVGKTTLLNIILGNLQPTEGKVVIGERTQFNYIDQNRETLNDEKTVFEEIGEGNDFVVWGDQKLSAWSYLKRFLFEDDRIKIKISQLSGGERNRLLLAKIMKRGGNFLILDEPSNDLDLSTLRVLEEALSNFGGCVIVVSHDRYFLNRVCTHILAFEGEGDVVFYEGDYTYYMEQRDQNFAGMKASKKGEIPVSAVEKATPKTRLTWKEKKDLETIEARILEAETEVARIEELFAEPDFFETHGEQLSGLQNELSEAQALVKGLYARWEELEAIS